MAECNYQSLLTDGRCFYGMSPRQIGAATLQLWCNISDGMGPPVPPEEPAGGIFNPEQPGGIFNPEQPGPITNPEA